jgi:hypothetical protein
MLAGHSPTSTAGSSDNDDSVSIGDTFFSHHGNNFRRGSSLSNPQASTANESFIDSDEDDRYLINHLRGAMDGFINLARTTQLKSLLLFRPIQGFSCVFHPLYYRCVCLYDISFSRALSSDSLLMT